MKIERIQELVNKLKSLVDDPQPGLRTWNEFLHERMTELITEYGGIIPKTDPVDEMLRADPVIQEEYGDLLTLFPDHRITRVEGVVRWEKNSLMCWICDHSRGSSVGLNAMAIAAQSRSKPFSQDEYMKFYRDLGYSLSGFIEIFGESLNLYQQQED